MVELVVNALRTSEPCWLACDTSGGRSTRFRKGKTGTKVARLRWATGRAEKIFSPGVAGLGPIQFKQSVGSWAGLVKQALRM